MSWDEMLFWVAASPFLLLPAIWAIGVVTSMFSPGPPVSQTARKYRRMYGE